MKIIIIARAGKTNLKNINKIYNIKCEDDFVGYIPDKNESTRSKLVDGYMDFIIQNGKIHTRTTYTVKDGVEITPEDKEFLIEYTQGQWSDGIGESFEQFPCMEEDGEEIFISPWYPKQKAQLIVINE